MSSPHSTYMYLYRPFYVIVGVRLQEIFLLPVRRISEYVQLLTWFELHTPHTHADRQDLSHALNTLTELDRAMREVRNTFSLHPMLLSSFSYPSSFAPSFCLTLNLPIFLPLLQPLFLLFLPSV